MRILTFLICIAGLLIPATALGGEDFIGGLRNVRGTAMVKWGEEQIQAKDGLRIHLNDVLITEKDGALGVVFKDDTRISFINSSFQSVHLMIPQCHLAAVLYSIWNNGQAGLSWIFAISKFENI